MKYEYKSTSCNASSTTKQPKAVSVEEKLNVNLLEKVEFIANVCCTFGLFIKVCVSVTGPVVAQRVGRGIALLFHDRSTRRA
jgi:hypothetical protein